MTDEEELRRTRAARLREKIDRLRGGGKGARPRTPREFTDAKAREAAEEARRKEAGDEASSEEDGN